MQQTITLLPISVYWFCVLNFVVHSNSLQMGSVMSLSKLDRPFSNRRRHTTRRCVFFQGRRPRCEFKPARTAWTPKAFERRPTTACPGEHRCGARGWWTIGNETISEGPPPPRQVRRRRNAAHRGQNGVARRNGESDCGASSVNGEDGAENLQLKSIQREKQGKFENNRQQPSNCKKKRVRKPKFFIFSPEHVAKSEANRLRMCEEHGCWGKPVRRTRPFFAGR